MKYHFLVLLLVSSICSAEQYICIAETSAGFNYSETSKKWESTRFNTEKKYIISESDSEYYAREVVRIGSDYPVASCVEGFNSHGYLLCSSSFHDFRFQKENGRYLISYFGGYYNVMPSLNEITDSTSDTPFMEIGKCSPF